MSSNYPIFQSSLKIKEDRRTNVKRNFPWNTIECGQSFAVPLAEMKFITLRSMASVKGKKLHKIFKVVAHNDVYEVARIE
jgi:hypothetical protein